MAAFTVEVAEVHYVTYKVDSDGITTPEQARAEVVALGENCEFVDDSLNSDYKVYDDSGELVLD